MFTDDELKAFLRKTRGCAIAPALIVFAIGSVSMLVLYGCMAVLFVATLAR